MDFYFKFVGSSVKRLPLYEYVNEATLLQMSVEVIRNLGERIQRIFNYHRQIISGL